MRTVRGKRVVCGLPRRTPCGFTLIELMVALVILGTLAGGLTLSFRTALDAQERIGRDGDEAQEIRVVVDAFRADIEQAALTAGSDRSWFIGTDEGDNENPMDTLRLTTRSHRVPMRDVDPSAEWESQARHADWSAVTYTIVPADEEEEGGLYRREVVPPGEDPMEETGQAELLSAAVAGLNFRYFDGVEWQETWDTTDANSGALPRAVEVTIILRPPAEGEQSRSVVAMFPVRLAAPAGEEAAVGGLLAPAGGLGSAP